MRIDFEAHNLIGTMSPAIWKVDFSHIAKMDRRKYSF